MRNKVYEFHYTPLRVISGNGGPTMLQTKLINPDGLGDMCLMRVLGPNKKVIVEGRCSLSALREVVDSGQYAVLAKNVELGIEAGEGELTSKYPHPAFRAACATADIRALVEALWAEYSDF